MRAGAFIVHRWERVAAFEIFTARKIFLFKIQEQGRNRERVGGKWVWNFMR